MDSITYVQQYLAYNGWQWIHNDTSLVYIILIIQSRIIPLFHFNLVLFQIVSFYFTCSCKLTHKTQSHFLSKGTSYRVSKNSSKGIKRRDSWKSSLVTNSRMLTPSSQSLWLSKQNAFIIFLRSGEIFPELLETQGDMH
jgi:predicted ferric reductase